MRLFRNPLSIFGRRRLADKILRADCVRLNIGAGRTRYKGWISVEKYALDITRPEDFSYFFGHKKISKILLEHVVEHIQQEDFLEFLTHVKINLVPGATIRIAVPDAYHPSEYVRELTKPGGLEPGADDHKVFYSIDLMTDIASKHGYTIKPIEFFDSKGFFHTDIDSWNNGYISRCSTNYEGRFTSNKDEFAKLIETTPADLRHQFIDNSISYTSLFVDFIKE